MKLLTCADISLYVTEEFALVTGGEKAKVGNKVETENHCRKNHRSEHGHLISVHKHNENSKRTILT